MFTGGELKGIGRAAGGDELVALSGCVVQFDRFRPSLAIVITGPDEILLGIRAEALIHSFGILRSEAAPVEPLVRTIICSSSLNHC